MDNLGSSGPMKLVIDMSSDNQRSKENQARVDSAELIDTLTKGTKTRSNLPSKIM